MNESEWLPLVNTSALAAFALFVMSAIWKLGKIGGTKAMELGQRYVTSTEALHETLRQSQQKQHELCTTHATAIQDVVLVSAKQIGISEESRDYLKSLAENYGPKWQASGAAQHNAEDLQRVKRVIGVACRMCRDIAAKEFPDSSDKVSGHCDEIERIIGEAK